MIQQESRLRVVDNTGAYEIQRIRILDGSTRCSTDIGDTIVATAKEAALDGNIKTDEIVKAVIVYTKKEAYHLDSLCISFDEDATVIIEANGGPRGIRILGPVACELRNKRFMKIVLLAPEVI